MFSFAVGYAELICAMLWFYYCSNFGYKYFCFFSFAVTTAGEWRECLCVSNVYKGSISDLPYLCFILFSSLRTMKKLSVGGG
mgnify:CR=1 FL=1